MKLPEEEQLKAYNKGVEDFKKGKEKDDCPYWDEILQHQWLSGFEYAFYDSMLDFDGDGELIEVEQCIDNK